MRPVPIGSHAVFPPPAPRSISMNLPILYISYKWNHTICDLCARLLSLSLFSKFIHVVVFHSFFKIFFFLAMAHGLVSQPGINLTRPAFEAQSLNHWAAKEVSASFLFMTQYYFMLWIYLILFIHFSFNGNLNCFPKLNFQQLWMVPLWRVVYNILFKHLFSILWGYIPRCMMAGSIGNSRFNLRSSM